MTGFFIKAIALCGAAALLVSSAHAEGTPEQRRACRKDAMTLCREFIPDVPKITACMEAKKAQLSPLCRTQFN
ncbi:hypothetical protein BH10PSE10_BH10PSE10_15180 [soil metagenome]